jgi:endonuclease YncB( thermonuclease family)
VREHLYYYRVAQALSLLFFCLFAQAQPLGPYTVHRVVDGDTVRLIIDGTSESIRLIGIDTPETVHPRIPVQPYGPEASAYLKALLPPGDLVRLELDVQARDRYGRLLGYVYTEDGRQVNLLIVQAGLARVLTIPPNVRYVDLYQAAAAGAQSVSKGLWADYGISFVDRDCRDFRTWQEAQAFFGGAGPGDLHRLDRNKNNVACDRLRKTMASYMAGR